MWPTNVIILCTKFQDDDADERPTRATSSMSPLYLCRTLAHPGAGSISYLRLRCPDLGPESQPAHPRGRPGLHWR